MVTYRLEESRSCAVADCKQGNLIIELDESFHNDLSASGIDREIWKCEKFNGTIIVPFCPEIYGGLPTPRIPSERIFDTVKMKDGSDVTENYKKGAREALELCRAMNIKKALLKEKSPSCAKYEIYDGSFTGTLVNGKGVASELLQNNGIEVFNENEIAELLG